MVTSPGARTGFELNTDERDLIRSLIVADPSLVLDDDQVMAALIGERAEPGRRIVDLRDRLVERLEGRLKRLVEANRSMIAAAYENVAGTEQLHRAVVALIAAGSLEEFLQTLVHAVPEMLSVEEARLCLEADVPTATPAEGLGEGLGARVVAMPEGTVRDYFQLDGAISGEGVALREAGVEAEFLFGPETDVRSEAVVLLDLAGAAAMVVFGAADPDRFTPDQGTDLLRFFGSVVERLLLQRLGEAGLS